MAKKKSKEEIVKEILCDYISDCDEKFIDGIEKYFKSDYDFIMAVEKYSPLDMASRYYMTKKIMELRKIYVYGHNI